jgi:hypothetical protein
MNEPVKTPQRAYYDKVEEVASQIVELNNLMMLSIETEPHWGHVGDVTYISEQLANIIQFARSGNAVTHEVEALRSENETLKARLQRLGG